MLLDKNIAISINYKIGKNIKNNASLSEFFEDVNRNNNTQTITIEKESYLELQKALVAGISAKSGKQNIRFKKATPDQVLANT
jgi:hypothetical protein